MQSNMHATAIDDLTVADLAALDAGTLAYLSDDLASQAQTVASRKTKLDAAFERRYGDAVRKALADKQTDTGTIHIADNTFDVVVTVPKTVDFDQDKLIAALDAMPVDKARHYAKAHFKVDERKFEAAPPDDKALLAPARTVKPGKPRFVFKPAAQEAA